MTERKGENSDLAERDLVRFRRLELAVFSGEDLMRWVFRAERYFLINGLDKDEKLEADTVCMENSLQMKR